MLELLEFTFRNGWHFAGVCVLLAIVGFFLPSSVLSITIRHEGEE